MSMITGEVADETGAMLVVLFNDEAKSVNENDFKSGDTVILHSVKVRISPVLNTNAWQIQPDDQTGGFKITIGM